MNGMMEVQQPPKTRRRVAAKAAQRQPVEKVKATLILSTEAYQRLGVYATMTGDDRSAVVEGLIREHLRRFVVSDRARNAGGVDLADGEDRAIGG